MASRKPEQKEILQYTSACTALDQPLNEDELDGEDLERIYQLENQDYSNKNRQKNGKKKNKSKKSKKWKALAMEMDSLLGLCQGREIITPLKEFSNKSSLSTKKKKRHSDSVPSSPLKKKKKSKGTNLGHSSISLFSPIKMKKNKKRKEKAQLAKESSLHGPSCSTPVQRKKPQCCLEDLYGYSRSNQSQRNLLNGEVVETDVPEFEGISHNVTCETTLYRTEETSLTNFQLTNSMNENNGRSSSNLNTHALPSLPPIRAESKTDHKMRDSTKSDSKFSGCSLDGNSSKQEDICNSSYHSQDLFITQKSFLPVQVSSSSSYESPPLGQEQAAGAPDGFKNYSRTDVLQLFSQVSTFTVRGANQSNISQCNLASVVKNSIILTEKATQTDDLFSYLSLMSFLKKSKILEKCSEQPLDLCLPTRFRAVSHLGFVCEKMANDDLIILDVKPPATDTPIISNRGKVSLSHLRRCDEGRFVQSLLNSSYFFKGKGDNSQTIHITPLLKQKTDPPKRVRKSVGFRQ